ncbi:MAG TPA: ThuA domain-containing protein [Pirellulales bacterium]|jgi:type 1 glutamine amidotransferase|nr:ThuA domain-containing protein [Pirellulales bacterium]
MPNRSRLLACGLVLLLASTASAEPQLKALIVDGQNNHDWKATTPLLKKHLEDSGLFKVDVATSPGGEDLGGFEPKFAHYQVVVSNYNGAAWPTDTQDALVAFVRGGGGLVIVHAANNSFPEWKEYNEMIALGGWGGRNEKWGPYVRFKDGKFVRDTSPGGGGSHGSQHAFQVVIRDGKHPITAGLPAAWLHAPDELYDRLRGPAENLNVLATAYSDPSTGGTGEHEPMIMTVEYGKGRVFHTPMGHSPDAMRCVGFIVVLQRGAEWAATGKVTQKSVPDDFPKVDAVSVR